jgi:hypothetical protein
MVGDIAWPLHAISSFPMGPGQTWANAGFEKHWNVCGKRLVVLIARKFGRPTNL